MEIIAHTRTTPPAAETAAMFSVLLKNPSLALLLGVGEPEVDIEEDVEAGALVAITETIGAVEDIRVEDIELSVVKTDVVFQTDNLVVGFDVCFVVCDAISLFSVVDFDVNGFFLVCKSFIVLFAAVVMYFDD